MVDALPVDGRRGPYRLTRPVDRRAMRVEHPLRAAFQFKLFECHGAPRVIMAGLLAAVASVESGQPVGRFRRAGRVGSTASALHGDES